MVEAANTKRFMRAARAVSAHSALTVLLLLFSLGVAAGRPGSPPPPHRSPPPAVTARKTSLVGASARRCWLMRASGLSLPPCISLLPASTMHRHHAALLPADFACVCVHQICCSPSSTRHRRRPHIRHLRRHRRHLHLRTRHLRRRTRRHHPPRRRCTAPASSTRPPSRRPTSA